MITMNPEPNGKMNRERHELLLDEVRKEYDRQLLNRKEIGKKYRSILQVSGLILSIIVIGSSFASEHSNPFILPIFFISARTIGSNIHGNNSLLYET